MNRPNPSANFDPTAAILIETQPDPDKGVSTALTVAVCDGYSPGPAWLVTKEGGEQSMVVLLTRPSRVGVATVEPAARRWQGMVVALVAVSVVGWCLFLASALR